MTLKHLRYQKGLTLQDVADRMNVTPGYVSHLETGRRRLSSSAAERLALALEESPKLVLDCAMQTQIPRTLANSWISTLRVGGLSFHRAFQYYAAALEQPLDWNNRFQVAQHVADFARRSIVPALLQELDSNEDLLTQLIAVSRIKTNNTGVSTLESKPTQQNVSR